MSYYTSVKVVKDSDGRPLEGASVSCDFTHKGYTDENGVCEFDMNYDIEYNMTVSKSYYRDDARKIKGGSRVTVRLMST